jgi:hypothetical protein
LNLQAQFNTGNNALAQDSNGKGGNSAEQSISHSLSSSQYSLVVSGSSNTIGSGNNVNVQSQVNTGNNAAAQG